MTATQGSASTEVLEGDILHTCASCGTHLASAEDVVSKGFQGKHGRAYLFSNVCVYCYLHCASMVLGGV